MSKIKIDKQYDEPWKVMKAASEGKRVAQWRDEILGLSETSPKGTIIQKEGWFETDTPNWNKKVAVILAPND